MDTFESIRMESYFDKNQEVVSFASEGESGYGSFYNSNTSTFGQHQSLLFSTPHSFRRSSNAADNRSLRRIPESPINCDEISDHDFIIDDPKENHYTINDLALSIGRSPLYYSDIKPNINLPSTDNNDVLQQHCSNHIPALSRSDKDKVKSMIPETPKSHPECHLNTYKINKSKEKVGSHVLKRKLTKRKLNIPEEKAKYTKKFHNGTTHVQFLEKLNRFPLVLDAIFEYLSDDDLYNLTLVSTKWKDIVYSNSTVRHRLFSHHNIFNEYKENIVKSNYKIDPPISQTCTTSKSVFGIHNNFGSNNQQIHNSSNSPYTSPSKRRFYENQKIVKTLGTGGKLMKCPRCSKESRIISTELTEQKRWSQKPFGHVLKDSTNLQQYSNPTKIILHNTLPTYPQRNTHNMTHCFVGKIYNTEPDIRSNRREHVETSYGECCQIKCQFKFCLKCQCEYHNETPCVAKSVSPSKEDVENGIVQISSSTIRIKKSKGKILKRLFF